jgi:hypothetical protein
MRAVRRSLISARLLVQDKNLLGELENLDSHFNSVAAIVHESVGSFWEMREPMPIVGRRIDLSLGDVPSRFLNDEPPVAAADAPGGAGAAGCASASDADPAAATPNWFADFLIDRATRKPSAHTLKAYRQDFTAVADLLTSGRSADVALIDITKDTMRAAFAAYASTHEPASIRRCWSTWNVLCDFLYTAELIAAKSMPFVGRPRGQDAPPLPPPTCGLRAARGGGPRPRLHAPHRLART